MDARVRAPELRGRRWLNTGGRELTLAQLRGRIVLLDFWTFCCINCLHVLDELRPLERAYADVLVAIGVHSPKFEHEKDPEALAAAVERYDVRHPVLDDPSMRMWREYAARAWPTLSVIDPEGYVVASMAGEGHADGLARLFDELIGIHQQKGTLRRGDGPYLAPEAPPSELRFPAKAAALSGGSVLVSDAAHHSLVELDAGSPVEPGAGMRVLRRIGSGRRGRADGGPGTAEFAEPAGVCLLPPRLAGQVGYDLVVADTANHLLRGVRLDTGEVRTVAGSGRPWRSTVDFRAHDALAVDLSSPWDVAWYDDWVIVAMAGVHQLWWFDPLTRTAGAYAGTAVESLRDGALREAWLAQPSGLSAAPDGSALWFVDSESSALRWVSGGEVHTAVGQGLFDFGHVDGAAADALLQHPLGVLALPDGAVLVADTYNGAVRRYDPASATITTVATGLAEPSDLVLTDGGQILVVESAAHRVGPLDPAALTDAEARATVATSTAAAGVGAAAPTGGAGTGAGTAATGRYRVERPATELGPGDVLLHVVFEPAPGRHLDDSLGPATRLDVSASPPELLVEGAGVGTELRRRLVVAADVDDGVLQVVAQAATCDADTEHAACHLTRQDWAVPVRVVEGAAGRLALILRGLDPQAPPHSPQNPVDGG